MALASQVLAQAERIVKIAMFRDGTCPILRLTASPLLRPANTRPNSCTPIGVLAGLIGADAADTSL